MKNKQQKKRGGFTSFIAAFCIIIYLFALIQAAVRIYLNIDECRLTAESEFARMKVLAVATGNQGFMDDRFVQIMNNALLSTKTIEAIIITGPDDDYVFEKQKGRAVTWSYRSPRFINRFSFSNISYNEPLPITYMRNTNIKAVASAFNYNDISKILKETLLLILIGFGLSFFTMIIRLLLGVKPQEKNSDYVSSRSPLQQNQQPAQNLQTAQPAQPLQEYSPVQQSGPKGLYSERSNIGWEEYTKDRLDAEVHRCASTEKDLTFMMIEISGILDDNAFKSAAEDASNILTGKDMLFEFGSQGIYAILPGIDLDSAIGKSEKFYQRIKQNHPECDLNIGLTSRSGRLINAQRLMMESKEALKKAKIDSATSIIAFKSDPDKYRNFIASQN